ncbi:YpjP family protein [Bacillus sp. B1-b2]|uniref:YpjP family protein n=1 Tax=Bacillus sp. B1-b2 TaxID=2653201 RepID=UPI001261AD19|nr:YpjP family protein [Bacillus sp. B1-b2]KAB7673010.1 hypothetical protein F9279_00870 [Bacillus sp. B1-b2]
MPNWIRKSLVVFVSILTFGLVSPSPTTFVNNNDNNDKKPRDEREVSFLNKATEVDTISEDTEELTDREKFISKMMLEAEEQSYLKFGSKIKPVIEDEFRLFILPEIEKAISDVTSIFPEEELSYLSITEQPSAGTSERIFHVSKEGNEDIIRFHVRRDRPPQEGYYFNFHYHTYQDEFQSHYVLGDIYWDKNTPPKWMS